jgi:hypothetical protein
MRGRFRVNSSRAAMVEDEFGERLQLSWSGVASGMHDASFPEDWAKA